MKTENDLLKIIAEQEQKIKELEDKLSIYEKDDFEDLYCKSIDQRKELENKNEKLQQKIKELEERVKKYDLQYQVDLLNSYEQIITNLKQQLHEQPKKICDDLREILYLDYDDKYGSICITGIKKALDVIQAKYEKVE